MALKQKFKLCYGFDIKELKKFKDGYLLKMGNAEYLLKKTRMSPAEIVFIFHCHQHLKDNKFVNFEKIIPTKDGCPYLRFNKLTYVLVEYFKKEPVELSEKQILNCIEFINSFHAASTNLKLAVGARYNVQYGKDRIAARNMYSMFIKLKEKPQLIKNEKLRDIIIRTIDTNIEYVKKALEILEDDRYLEVTSRSMQENRFIHGKLTINNIYKCYNKLRLGNMFDLELNVREKDIATFIKSLLRIDKNFDFEDCISKFYNASYNNYKKLLVLAMILLPYEYFSLLKKIIRFRDLDWASEGFEEKFKRLCEKDQYKNKILASLH
ncbi:protein kinase family protein [Anaerocellum diazotrophicum]|uniref:Spore coat protein, CotS family n=1 Tax=Caldicellulosiruptor diazotrophicus TaxID=2806205 RepID=A0ABN6E8T7_9FIRM|nr:hypothetical protein [Caldicellulosiruptor diazotrophicus]BCS81950.1 hypothetical protein CaldiYA01_19100 [Caldicellulosiruptor diazotrophicus]